MLLGRCLLILLIYQYVNSSNICLSGCLSMDRVVSQLLGQLVRVLCPLSVAHLTAVSVSR
jgi:hypothetical protein